MTAEEVLAKVRSRGHWRINIRPSVFDEGRIKQLSVLSEAVASSRVDLRGWPYPYFDRGEPPALLTDHIQQMVAGEEYHELWRLYQSGQFIHLLGMREDWWDSSFGQPKVQPGTVLSLSSTLFTLSEVFLFAARLTEALTLGPQVVVSYRLIGLAGRQLQTFEPNRVPLGPYRRASEGLTEFGQALTQPAETLIARAAEFAVDEVLKVYERFTWTPARESVVEEQRKFLERRR